MDYSVIATLLAICIIVLCGAWSYDIYNTPPSDYERTMQLFDRCLIEYVKQTVGDHIFLVVSTAGPKIIGVNTNEIRWKFHKDGSLYMVEAI